MNPMWLIRAKRWAENPPSKKRIQLVFGVIAACLILVGVEHFIGLPDWMNVERHRRFGR